MTNGIAVHLTDKTGRDYWHNNTCCSGYCFDGRVIEALLKEFLRGDKSWNHLGVERLEEIWLKYSHFYKLAVPEQLVWWQDE